MKQSNEKMKWKLTLKDKSPILIIFHSSSLKGSCPLTTKLALNLSIKLSTWFILSSTCELKKKNSLMMKVLKVSYHIANRVVTFVLKYYVELIWISENLTQNSWDSLKNHLLFIIACMHAAIKRNRFGERSV